MSKNVLCRLSVRRAGTEMNVHSSGKYSRSYKMSVRGCHTSLLAAYAVSHLQSESILVLLFEICKFFEKKLQGYMLCAKSLPQKGELPLGYRPGDGRFAMVVGAFVQKGFFFPHAAFGKVLQQGLQCFGTDQKGGLLGSAGGASQLCRGK
ncbi:MAG: hypothetical protein KatS3mg033_1002 [Thermonema sp.]|nr:MAG: hypothetical protein KatS3mg033_1002 [Thermonema sp.]